MLIQIILLAVVALIIIRLLARFRAKELSFRQLCGWLFIWLLAALVIAWPGLTVGLANYVGIGRGSDLVVYSALIFLFYFIFRLLLRIERLEKNLTKVVRQEALDEAEKK